MYLFNVNIIYHNEIQREVFAFWYIPRVFGRNVKCTIDGIGNSYTILVGRSYL